MFYEPPQGHGLPYNPFKAIVAPRPIGWMSTVDVHGRPNLAPYSFFNALCSKPDMIGFTSEGYKHTARNARETGEFVYNLATMALVDAMSETSADLEDGVSEFEFAGLTPAPCRVVGVPRVAESPASLECRLVHFMELNDLHGRPTDRYLLVGQVVGVHIDERYINNGRFDLVAAGTVTRCGYHDYATVERLFELLRPSEREAAGK